MNNSFTTSFQAPSVQEFVQLRAKVGWQTNAEVAQQSLDASLFHVIVRDNEKLLGMARIVGDGYMYFYIQDVIVDPDYHGKSLGKLLMDAIEGYIAKQAVTGATVALLAAQGKEGFYRQYGYLDRAGEPLGLGMCKFL